MKLKSIDLFATPENWDALMKFTSSTNDPAISTTSACMGWNLACAMAAKKEKKEEEEND